MKNSHTLSFLWIHSYLTVDCNPTQSGEIYDRASRWRVEIPDNAVLWMIVLLLCMMSDMARAEVTLVSVDSTGLQGNDVSRSPRISADGRFVVFESDADNLIPEDTNGFGDVFVKNVGTGEVVRVSEGAGGEQANADSSIFSGSQNISISADGQYVAFVSLATNLVPGTDTNDTSDVFVKNVETGEIIRVSENADGVQVNAGSVMPSINADGRFLAFVSEADNLVPEADTNAAADVFIRNMETGEVIRASEDAGGVQANFGSVLPSISADGQLVAFVSEAINLVPGDDTNDQYDVFVKNMQTGEVIRVSENTQGVQANRFSSNPSISADGRYVAFDSFATNLVVGVDTNDARDVFVKDLETGEVNRVSENAEGGQPIELSDGASISADGRFVAFQSAANELVLDDNCNNDVFVKNVETGEIVRVSEGPLGVQANRSSDFPSISADGRLLAFQSGSTNLIPDDFSRSSVTNIFLADVVWPDASTLRMQLRSVVYSSSTAEIFWDRFPNNRNVLYEVTRNGELLGVIDALSVYVDDLQQGVQYTYTVTVIDNSGDRLATDTVGFTTDCFRYHRQTEPRDPSTPENVTFAVYSKTAAEVFWDRSSDDGFVQGYEITRNGELVGILDVQSVFDDDLIPGVTYTYTIAAVDNEGNRSATSTIRLTSGTPIVMPPRDTGVINSSNYLDVLSYVFDIYNGSADGYGQAILDLPGLSDERYSNPPELIFMEEGPPAPGPPENLTCSNGGTAVFTPLSFGFLEITEGWNAEFDNCQDGSTVFDGQLRRVADSSEHRASTDPLLVDTQEQQTRFLGILAWQFTVAPGDSLNRTWKLTDVSHAVVSNGETVFELTDATVDLTVARPVYRELSGGFSIRSTATGDHTLRVDIPDRLYQESLDLDNDGFRDIETFYDPPRYEQGRMIITAQDGSTLILDADAGDPGVAEIILSDGDYRESFIRPWDFLAAEQMQPLRLLVPE